MDLYQFLLNDLQSGRLWLHLAIVTAIVAFLTTITIWDMKHRRRAFAEKWQIDLPTADRLYRRHFGFLNQNWSWLWASPLFGAVLIILPLCLVPVAGGLKLMAELEIYLFPIAITATGVHILLMPIEELRYRHRIIGLKPADVGNPTAIADIEAALRGGTERFVHVRVTASVLAAIGLSMIASVLIYHPMAWVDLVLPHCRRC